MQIICKSFVHFHLLNKFGNDILIYYSFSFLIKLNASMNLRISPKYASKLLYLFIVYFELLISYLISNHY